MVASGLKALEKIQQNLKEGEVVFVTSRGIYIVVIGDLTILREECLLFKILFSKVSL